MNIQLVSKRVHFVGFLYPKCDPRPLVAMDEAMENAMLNCRSNVCDNDSMSIFKDCPNNELLELLKTRKHAKMFVHMQKYVEHKNHVLHNSRCESNSLIEKYKRRNRILCDKVDHLKKKIQSSKRIENEDDFPLKVKSAYPMLASLCTPL